MPIKNKKVKLRQLSKKQNDLVIYKQDIKDIIWTEFYPLLERLAEKIAVESIKKLYFGGKSKKLK